MIEAPIWLIVAAGLMVGVGVGILGTSGALMIPTLVFVFGMTQLKAQGTSLFVALVPIWIAPIIPYWRAGNVDWRLGLTLAGGLAIGGYFGAVWAQHLPIVVVRRLFAVMLAAVAVRMFMQR